MKWGKLDGMKRGLLFGIATMLVAVGTAIVMQMRHNQPERSDGTMTITSSVFAENGAIPTKYGGKNDNVNPPLKITGAPTGAVTLALVMDDPDAPGGTFDHWVVWNIPGNTDEIPEGWTPPNGVSQGTNGYGKAGYAGPTPPSGVHHYHFRVYALDTRLNLAPSTTREQLETALSGHVLGQAELVGTFAKE